jgi:hypothetical protein
MHTAVAEAVLALSITALAGDAAGANGYKTSCTATAGLAKHVPATTTAATERTGSYEVTLTGGGQTAELRVEPKKPVSAGEATKVAAPIDGVLLRSPYKSEATALPTQDSRAKSATTHVATFDIEAIRALPAGDVHVVVMTPDGERVCTIKGSARTKLTAKN